MSNKESRMMKCGWFSPLIRCLKLNSAFFCPHPGPLPGGEGKTHHFGVAATGFSGSTLFAAMGASSAPESDLLLTRSRPS